MNDQETFLQDCKDWLTPFWYSLHSTRRQAWKDTGYVFTNFGSDSSNAVISVDPIGKTVDLSLSGPLKMYVSLEVEGLQYRHPDFSRFLDAVNHYGRVCERYPFTR